MKKDNSKLTERNNYQDAKNIKLKNRWLTCLEIELKALPRTDRDDIVDDYRDMIETRLESGEKIDDVIVSLESAKSIAKNVYAELLGSTPKIRQNWSTLVFINSAKIFGCFWIWIIGIFPLILTCLFFSLMIIFILLPIYGFFAFGSYDVPQAFGYWFMVTGLTPLIMLIFYVLCAISWVFLRIFVGGTIKLFSNGNTLANKIMAFSMFKLLKRMNHTTLIVFGVIFAVFLVAGIPGTLAGPNTIIGGTIHEHYRHFQFSTKPVDGINRIDISNLGLGENKTISVEREKISSKAENNVRVTRWYNHRNANIANIVFNVNDDLMKISSTVGWIDQINNFSVAKYEIIIPMGIMVIE